LAKSQKQVILMGRKEIAKKDGFNGMVPSFVEVEIV
jgi:hypothetical protein